MTNIFLLILLVLIISLFLLAANANRIASNYNTNSAPSRNTYLISNIWIPLVQVIILFIILLWISIINEEKPQQQNKNIITNNIINMDTAKALPTITEWVHRVMTNNKQSLDLEPQNFNVTPYSQEDKNIAMKELEERGYKVELENNSNSMKVEIKSLFKNPVKK